MKITGKFLIALISAAMMISCATTDSDGVRLDSKKQETLEEKLAKRNLMYDGPVERIRNYRMSGWSYVDNYNVIVTAGVSDRYLVTLRYNCNSLLGADSIAFTSTVGSLTTSDTLLVQGLGGYLDRCHIKSIGRLAKLEDK